MLYNPLVNRYDTVVLVTWFLGIVVDVTIDVGVDVGVGVGVVVVDLSDPSDVATGRGIRDCCGAGEMEDAAGFMFV